MEASMNYYSNKYTKRVSALAPMALMLANCLLCLPLHAADISDNYQIHGFASQSYITTTDNNFFGESSANDNFGYTELGINALVRPTEKLHIAGQLLMRRAGESDDGKVRLDYGLADYTIISNPTKRLGVRGGRLLNPLGFYNETRDVALTRPSILLPQSIYFDRARDLALSSDGVQVYGEQRLSNQEFYWQLSVANPRVDNPEIEWSLLGIDWPGDLEPDSSYLGRLLWERDGGRIRASLSAIQANIHYDPGTADPLSGGSIIFEPTVLSLQYNSEFWSLTSEYALRHLEYKDFNFFAIPDMGFTGESYYMLGSYRFAPKWDGFLRYDATFTDKGDRNGEEYEAVSPGTRVAHKRYAKDLTAGLGWMAAPKVLIRGEIHVVEGTAWLPALDNTDPLSLKKYWNMFILSLSYRF
jgi:hypothetical protein